MKNLKFLAISLLLAGSTAAFAVDKTERESDWYKDGKKDGKKDAYSDTSSADALKSALYKAGYTAGQTAGSATGSVAGQAAGYAETLNAATILLLSSAAINGLSQQIVQNLTVAQLELPVATGVMNPVKNKQASCLFTALTSAQRVYISAAIATQVTNDLAS